MRISIRGLAYACDAESGKRLRNAAVLAALHGWRYEADSMYNYLDMELVDFGVTGGLISAERKSNGGLEIVIDYWAPGDLQEEQLAALLRDTAGQLSDGIGEGGFDVVVDGQAIRLMPDDDAQLSVQQYDDGKLVSQPSRVARAAREGDLPSLQAALAAGEDVDSTLQGYTGLHLAILKGHANAALILIDRGANPNLLSKSGKTSLQHCASANSLTDKDSAAVAKALLNHGADRTITTSTGETASSYAELREKTQTLRVLNETT